MSLYSFALRASFKISDTMRDRGLHDPAGIAHYDDLAYGPDPRWQACNAEECEFFKRFIKGKEPPYESR